MRVKFAVGTLCCRVLVVCLALLLLSGSYCEELTTALFTKVPAPTVAGAFTITVTLIMPLVARLPKLQVNTPETGAAQVPKVEVAETKVVSGGKVSVSTILEA